MNDMHCHCDGFCRPIEACSECMMALEIADAAGRDLVREIEATLRFRASASVRTRRAP